MFDPFYPFDWLATQIVTRIFKLSVVSQLGSSLHFFLYDVPKVLTLLIVISFIVGTFQTFLEPEWWELLPHFVPVRRCHCLSDFWKQGFR
jgi:uncharacterized membrane protein YraQ (UPF0718 family)